MLLREPVRIVFRSRSRRQTVDGATRSTYLPWKIKVMRAYALFGVKLAVT